MTIKVRTGYSFRTAWGHLPDVISRLKEIGATHAPITDRASTYGHTRFAKLCKEAGLAPAYGVELGVCSALGEKKQTLDFFSFLATDTLRPLHDLIYLATSNPGKEPSILYKQAMAAPGLIKIAGERVQLSSLTDEDIGQSDFYIGLSPSVSKGLFRKALERGCKFIATSDNYYPRQEDEEAYRIALGWRAGTQTYARHILSDDEWREAVSAIASPLQMAQAIANRDAALRQCTAVQKKGALLQAENESSLREICLQGALQKGIDISIPVYKERLDKELALIEEKEFSSYFFIVSDLVKWAKERMVVGPARGSSCGSLVCYLLDITSIDPIPFNLIFERFIDLNRGGWKFKKQFEDGGFF